MTRFNRCANTCETLCDPDVLSLDVHKAKDVMALFNLNPIAFDLSVSKLKDEYLKLQFCLHPDRFASSEQAQRDNAAGISSIVSSCYTTLRDPLSRAALFLASSPGNQLSYRDEKPKNEEDDDYTDYEMALFAEILEIEESIEALRNVQEANALQRALTEKYSTALNYLYEAFQKNDFHEANKVLQHCQMLNSVNRKVSYWIVAQSKKSDSS